MIKTLYIDARLDKQMKMLRQAGKKGALAVEQAQGIIAGLKAGKFFSSIAGSMTKHGEQRIKGCIKYDLGSGYRLVTLKQGGNLYLLYAGSHDECHRWIENNRELIVADIRMRCQRIPVENARLRVHDGDADFGVADQEENDDFLEDLDDRQLRTIFSGLIQSIQN